MDGLSSSSLDPSEEPRAFVFLVVIPEGSLLLPWSLLLPSLFSKKQKRRLEPNAVRVKSPPFASTSKRQSIKED
jgi:hypothetical protein